MTLNASYFATNGDSDVGRKRERERKEGAFMCIRDPVFVKVSFFKNLFYDDFH